MLSPNRVRSIISVQDYSMSLLFWKLMINEYIIEINKLYQPNEHYFTDTILWFMNEKTCSNSRRSIIISLISWLDSKNDSSQTTFLIYDLWSIPFVYWEFIYWFRKILYSSTKLSASSTRYTEVSMRSSLLICFYQFFFHVRWLWLSGKETKINHISRHSR